MDWGLRVAYLMIGLNLVTSACYLASRDYRKSLYFLFAAAITLTVVWR